MWRAWRFKGFCLQMQTLERQKGIEVLKEACVACGESIATKKGRMTVKDEARVVRGPASLATVPFTTPQLLCCPPGPRRKCGMKLVSCINSHPRFCQRHTACAAALHWPRPAAGFRRGMHHGRVMLGDR